jgi:hypothetical protein
MSATPASPACRFLPDTGRGAARFERAANGVWRSAGLAAAGLCLAACAALPPAGMRMPAGLQASKPVPFDGLGGGRSGRFTLDGQTVSFQRTGDSLSVFDALRLDRVSVDFEHPDARGRCDGRGTALTAGILDTPARPLALSCRFAGRVTGELRLTESRLAGAGTRQAREGEAVFGTVVIGIRSEHALAGSPVPLSQPAGYRLTIQGRDVAALDLAGGTPVLRKTEGLEPYLRDALTQAALALGLWFDPAVTRG